MENIHELIQQLETSLNNNVTQSNQKLSADLLNQIHYANANLYRQIESLTWLSRNLKIKGSLPPLRGWAASPDTLLKLHQHILRSRPSMVVEFGSGASTVVIADALKQNKKGKLLSIDHFADYAQKIAEQIQQEKLSDYVEFQSGELTEWTEEHLSPKAKWYPLNLLDKLKKPIDLVFVDGPPGQTNPFARFPALPAIFNQLSDEAQVWLDDAMRADEQKICQHWAKEFKLSLSFEEAEKGLAILKKQTNS